MHEVVRQKLQKYVGHYYDCLTKPCSSCVHNRQQNSVLKTLNVGNFLLSTYFFCILLQRTLHRCFLDERIL